MTRLRSPLTLTAFTVALAAGAALAAGVAFAAAAATGEPAKESRIKLILNQDGAHEGIELENLHDLALGESRSFTTESGKAGTVTRTEKGFELDLDGKKITIAGEPEGATEGDGDVVVFHKKIEIAEGDDARTMVWHSAEAADGHQVKVIRKAGGPDGNYAFFAGPHAEMHAAKLADAWIERLRQSAEFQALDAATRERVETALRATAPGGPGVGATTMVIEVEEREEDGGE